MPRFALALGLLLVTGCAMPVGTFVTDLSPLGNGRVAVTRCDVNQSAWDGEVKHAGCQTTVLDLLAAPQSVPAAGQNTSGLESSPLIR